MDWLSGLVNKVKQTAGTVWGALTSPITSPSNPTQAGLASVVNTAGGILGGALNGALGLLGLNTQAQAPTVHAAGTPGSLDPSVRARDVSPSAYEQQTGIKLGSNAFLNPGDVIGSNGMVKSPSTSSTPLTSTPSTQPNTRPYIGGNNGNPPPYTPQQGPTVPLIAPAVAGQSGQSGAANPLITGYQAAPGSNPLATPAKSGTAGDIGSGRSNYTGIAGAAGGVGTPSSSGPSSTEEQKKTQQPIKPIQQFIPTKSPYELPPGFTATTTPQGGTAYKSPEGNVYLPSNGGLTLAPNKLPGQLGTYQVKDATYTSGAPVSEVNVQPYEQPFNVTTPSGALNLSDIQGDVSKITDLLKNPLTAESKTQIQQRLSDYTTYLKGQLDKMTQNSGPVVTETPEQTDFVKSYPPEQQTGLMAQMDAKRSELGLPDLEKQLLTKTNQKNALDLALKKITDDIKNNPDLPKGLAARRITEFTNENLPLTQALQNEIEYLTQQRNYANDQLNQYFNIAKYQTDTAQNTLQMYINSGAIANFTDSDITNLASSTGISESSLRSIKTAVTQKQKQYSQFSTATNENGDVTVYGITNDGQVKLLKTIAGAGKPSGGNSEATLSSAQLQKLSVGGVPNAVAQAIQKNLNAGNDLETIRQGLAKQFGRDIGFGYLDKFMSTIQGDQLGL